MNQNATGQLRMNVMTKLFFSLCLAMALLAKIATAQADVMYKCVDEDDRKTFSNVKLSGNGVKCTAMELPPVTSVPPAQVSRPAGRSAASPDSFPKVGENAQKERDNDRRRILENELEAERGNLEQAKKDLADQEKIRTGDERNFQQILDRIEPYKNKAALHERNIEAIEKELAKLR
jgi:hypothetical protein